MEVDFDGRVKRLDARPEEAALALLELNDEARDGARSVLARRSLELQRILSRNTDLLVKLGNSSQAGEKLKTVAYSGELLARLAPLRRDGSLADQLRAALPPDAADRFDALVSEYWDALGDEAAGATQRGRRLARAGAIAQEHARLITEELGRAFERAACSGVLVAELLVGGLELTAEQRGRVDEALVDLNLVEMDVDRRSAAVAVAVLAHLNADQRAEALRRLMSLR